MELLDADASSSHFVFRFLFDNIFNIILVIITMNIMLGFHLIGIIVFKGIIID